MSKKIETYNERDQGSNRKYHQEGPAELMIEPLFSGLILHGRSPTNCLINDWKKSARGLRLESGFSAKEEEELTEIYEA